MDATALSLCMDKGMPLVVFNIFNEGNLAKLLDGEKVGTHISQDVTTAFATV